MEEAQREFLRITDVTDNISDSSMCLAETSVVREMPVSEEVVMIARMGYCDSGSAGQGKKRFIKTHKRSCGNTCPPN